MRKWIITGILICILSASTVYAHVSGAFGDFLAGIKDESTTKQLKQEIEATKQEIERLTPKVHHLEKQFDQKMKEAEPIIQFYNTIGLDTYMNFLLQSETIVDVLANQRIIEKKLNEDLHALNALYLDYMSLKLAKESLEGHAELLRMIEDNLEAREQFFVDHPGLPSEVLANLVVTNWETNAGDVDELLLADSELLNENMSDFITQKTEGSPYRLEDNLLNEISPLDYYFRSDHVYVHYQKKDADVILIGTVVKSNNKMASLKFEAGFINGIQISSNLTERISGFQLDYGLINPQSKGFYVEQTNGAIVIQPVENSGE
jgi:peptidoglycan hydrolase CwlO-like protein